MATIHFVLSSRGGVGTTLVSSLLAEYYLEQEKNLECFDLDRIHHVLSRHELLQPKKIKFANKYDSLRIELDAVIEEIVSMPNETKVLIDVSSLEFLSICDYLLKCNVMNILKEYGHQVTFHSIVAGGDYLLDTMRGLEALFMNFSKVPFVVWENHHFGELKHGPVEFQNSKLFRRHKEKVKGLISIGSKEGDYFWSAVEEMMQINKPISKARDDITRDLFTRQRLVTLWRDLRGQLTEIGI